MTHYKQLCKPNIDVGYTGSWCLNYVQRAFNTAHTSTTALNEWKRLPQHQGTPPVGVSVPVFFTLGAKEPAGHVAIWLPDGQVASSTLKGWHQKAYIHPNLQDLINTYNRAGYDTKYIGWSDKLGYDNIIEITQNDNNNDKKGEDMRQIVLLDEGIGWFTATHWGVYHTPEQYQLDIDTRSISNQDHAHDFRLDGILGWDIIKQTRKEL